MNIEITTSVFITLVLVFAVGGGITAAVINVPSVESSYCAASYEVLDYWSSSSGLGIFQPVSYALHVKIRNTDDKGGYFTVSYTINKKKGGTVTDSSKLFIKPYETATISSGGHGFEISSWRYVVDAPAYACTQTVKRSLLSTLLG